MLLSPAEDEDSCARTVTIPAETLPSASPDDQSPGEDRSLPDALDISPSSFQDEIIPQEALPRKGFCARGTHICCCCGPLVARWQCCIIHLVVLYFALTPLLYLAIHFSCFPGNVHGDVHVSGAQKIEFVAEYDFRRMRGLTAPCPEAHLSHADEAAKRQRQLDRERPVAPLIFFGGNAEGMSGSVTDAQIVFSEIRRENSSYDFQIYSAAYRGYEPNEGWISQRAVTSDAEDLLDFALNHSGATNGRAFLAGWSMGAGVAVQLASKRPESIAGLMVISPWSTLHEEALDILAPLTWLIWPWIWTLDGWDSVSAMASLPEDIPVAVMSASSDDVIRPWQHKKVYDAACPGAGPCSRKWFMPTPHAGHGKLKDEAKHNMKDLLEFTASAWPRVQAYSWMSGDSLELPSQNNTEEAVFNPIGTFRTWLQTVVYI